MLLIVDHEFDWAGDKYNNEILSQLSSLITTYTTTQAVI